MGLIEYYQLDTFFHRFDPRVKIIMLLTLTLAIFLIKSFWVIGLIFLTALSLWISAGLPLGSLKTYFKFLFSLFALLIILQGLFLGGETTLFAPIIPSFMPLVGGIGRLTLEGVLFGVLLSLRLLTLVILLPLVTMTTPIHLFALGLIRLGVSHKIAYTATTTINLIPVLRMEAVAIMDAQKLRGFSTFDEGRLFKKLKAYPTLVMPLVIGAMRDAQLMGVAMDVRAFGTSKGRTYVDDIRMSAADWVMLSLVLLYCLTVLYLNFFML